MRLIATYQELVAVELPEIKKEEFNNTLNSLICDVNKDTRINEVLLTGFPFERLGEMFYILQGATETGYVIFKQDGVLYTKSSEKLHLKFDSMH